MCTNLLFASSANVLSVDLKHMHVLYQIFVTRLLMVEAADAQFTFTQSKPGSPPELTNVIASEVCQTHLSFFVENASTIMFS